MQQPDPNEIDPPGESPQEERIGELINEFFDRRERGESVSEEQFLAQYPEHADELRLHLGGLHLLGALGSSADGKTISRMARPKFKGSSSENVLPEAASPIPDIPGYQVQKLIGRGGMGLVYKSIQVSTKRVVALKVLLEGPFATETARRRFEREISLAAQLRHPNIIPIYDSGTVEGRMYYAMEYVFGLPLSEYFRTHSLDLRARLALLIKVFMAVNHAHQRGVIHRDLKPSNILVDGNGEPHILDFGLAKSGGLGDVTTSITAQIVGTPAYMSPEQASADPNSVDIRTDVYSLGIVLYEAICGKMPYETNLGIGRILHNIAHAEPVAPTKQNPKIDAELAAITLKAIEKIKESRYQSVEGFAEDLRRYLAGEPILARPPTGMYLIKKALWKNRVSAGILTVAIVVALISYLGIRKYSVVTTERERDRQELAQVRQQKQQLLEEKKAAQSPPSAQAGLEAMMDTVNVPEEWKAVLKVTGDPSKPKEEKAALLALMAANLLNEATAEKEASFKQPTVEDVNPPRFSERPRDEAATQPSTASISPEATKALLRDAMERMLVAGRPRAPTSAPAVPIQTTQPVASQPAIAPTTAPATSQPSPSGS